MQLFPSSASSYLICVNVWLTREAIQGMGHNMQISSFLNIKTIKIRDLIQRVSSPQCNLLKKKHSLHKCVNISWFWVFTAWKWYFCTQEHPTGHYHCVLLEKKLYKSKLGKSYPQENAKWTPWTKLLARKSATKGCEKKLQQKRHTLYKESLYLLKS